MGLTEIHLSPGQHKLLVHMSEKMDSGQYGWSMVTLNVDLHPGDGYVVRHEPRPGNRVRVWVEDKNGKIVSRP